MAEVRQFNRLNNWLDYLYELILDIYWFRFVVKNDLSDLYESDRIFLIDNGYYFNFFYFY